MKTNEKSRAGVRRQRLVHGVVVNDADYAVQPKVDGKLVRCPFYQRWLKMLERCYSSKFLTKYPTYVGCTVDSRWHSFMTFREWMVEQPWAGRELDKDIIVPGNRIYSPDTCMFVPQAINSLLTDSAATRGEYPQGVSWHKRDQKFQANLRINGKSKHIGLFPTVAEAEAVYRKAKADLIFNTAFLLGPDEDPRLRPALLQIASIYENA